MIDYFSQTAVYKIWIDVISFMVPKSTFIPKISNFGFSQIICTSEDLKEIYTSSNRRLELIYSHTSRMFFCRLADKTTNMKIDWNGMPPELKKVSDLMSLEKEIEKWLNFIETEIG